MKTCGIYLICLLLVVTESRSSGQDRPDFAPGMLMRALRVKNASSAAILPTIRLQGSDGEENPTDRFYLLSGLSTPRPAMYAFVGRVSSCRTGGCIGSSQSGQVSESEYFDYFILFDRHGRVLEVRVFNYQATHGHEITARGWLRQFTGYDGNTTLQAGKNIDAITGATISVSAISADVEYRTQLLKSYLSDLKRPHQAN